MDTLSPSVPLLSLAGLLAEPLLVVDIGARWGFSQIWAGLGDRCVSVGFEPDRVECERLVTLHQGRRNLRFVPLALGARPGLATLYLTKNRGGCSVYPPSVTAMHRHPGLEGSLVEGTTVIEMTTLDDWCASDGIERIDAVKIDTQGSELDILRGGARVLETVRAVEVEVEFNELYDGIPLFGDIDRFLRQHGFVLWKLRDLAHYAKFRAPAGWRTLEASHYDEYMATYPGGAGQLYWANAFYLKTDVAHPDAGLGWEQLVRDACVTSVHKFYDLSALALDLARETAPAGVVSAIDTARSEEVDRFRYDTATTSTALTATLKLSMADPAFAGGGWQPLQMLDEGGVRWSGPGRDAWIDVPVTLPPGTRIEVLAVAVMNTEISEGVVVEANGVPLHLSRTPHRQGILYSGDIPPGYQSPRRFTRVMIRTPATVPWNSVHPGDDEDSELGVAVSWLRFTPPAE